MHPVPNGEFAGVFRLVNCYAAVHVNNGQKEILSEFETDMRTAAIAAKKFAENKNIPFHMNLLDVQNPVISICQDNGKWYPAELHSTKITILTEWGPLKLGDTKEAAEHMGECIATGRGADFMPAIGEHVQGIAENS